MNVKIKYDPITQVFIFSTMLFGFYFIVNVHAEVLILPIMLLFGGLIGALWFRLRSRSEIVDDEEIVSEVTALNLGLGIALYLITTVIYILSAKFVPTFPVPFFEMLKNLNIINSQLSLSIQMSGVDAVTYSVFMAICEEIFFRCFWMDLLMHYTTPYFAVGASAATWTAFHALVYGTNQAALVFIMGSGLAFGFFVITFGYYAPSFIAHITNNALSSMAKEGMITLPWIVNQGLTLLGGVHL